jgi:hypothetical protein
MPSGGAINDIAVEIQQPVCTRVRQPVLHVLSSLNRLRNLVPSPSDELAPFDSRWNNGYLGSKTLCLQLLPHRRRRGNDGIHAIALPTR